DVLGHVLRFTIAGSIGYIASAFINVFLVSKWKVILRGKWYILRSIGSTAVGEAVATYLVGFMTFYKIIPVSKILLIITTAFIYKTVYGCIIVLPTAILVRILKKYEADVYEPKATINPFKF